MHVIIEADAVAVVVFELLAVAGTRVVVDSLSATNVVVEVVEVVELDAEAGVSQIPLAINKKQKCDKIIQTQSHAKLDVLIYT